MSKLPTPIHDIMPLRWAFTLVELLVVMVIASMVAATAMIALWGAQEEARIQRTRAQIAKIHEILLPHFEAYTTRPVRLPAGFPHDRRRGRLLVLRDYMRMEFPDRIRDVLDDSLFPMGIPPVVPGVPEPAMRRAIKRRYDAVVSAGGNWSVTHEQAECLYLILSVIRHDDRDALTYFRDSEIGDVDNDGFREILDAWGNPIAFLRWAPGFSNSFIQNPRVPDPFDPLRVDDRWNDPSEVDPFLLFPLVFSAGPNALVTDSQDRIIDYGIYLGEPNFSYRQPSATPWYRMMDPFWGPNVGLPFIGTPQSSSGERLSDNLITNHDPETL